MDRIECRTQAEMDAAIKAGAVAVLVDGVFWLVTDGTEAPEMVVHIGVELIVEAWGSSAPRVDACDSSAPHVVAWGSSAPRVVARGSSAPRVDARDSSAPRVEARGYVSMTLTGALITATATATVMVMLHKGATCEGGIQQKSKLCFMPIDGLRVH